MKKVNLKNQKLVSVNGLDHHQDPGCFKERVN